MYLNFGGAAHLGSVKRITGEKFEQIIAGATRRGMRLYMTPGDSGIDSALGIYEKLLRHHPIEDYRYVVSHCFFPTPSSLAKMEQLRSVPTRALTSFLSRAKE